MTRKEKRSLLLAPHRTIIQRFLEAENGTEANQLVSSAE
jgi:hypothetical protein